MQPRLWTRLCFSVLAVLFLVSNGVDCCGSFFGLERMFSSPFGTQRSTNELSTESSHAGITRINSPGQRFTATHGISAKRGERKLFVFVVDRTDVNYLAVSSNIAIEGSRGGPERYELYMKYGSPPTEKDFDQRSTLTASDSYVGDVLYSRDITVPRPSLGEYYFLLVASKNFHELLVTAIMDTPRSEEHSLNSSHITISYAVFCLKKKNKQKTIPCIPPLQKNYLSYHY